MFRFSLTLAAGFTLAACCGPVLGQLTVLPLIPSESGSTFGYGVSSDGSFIAGSGGSAAYRWSINGTATPTGSLGSPPGSAVAYAVSNGGTVVVGQASTQLGTQAFRWTPNNGMIGLGHLPGDDYSYSTDVSANGSITVGSSTNATSGRAFRHTNADGMQSIGSLPGYAYTIADSISADGSVIVGHGTTSSGNFRAFRWTTETGIVDLGFNGLARVVSSNGLTIGGGNNLGPCLWTQAGGLMQLPLNDGVVTGVSNHASIAVGNGQFGQSGPDRAFVWTSTGGMRQLQSYLTGELGWNLNGFNIRNVEDVSADGRVIIGFGDLPGGPGRAFVAVVPTPGALAMLAIALARPRRRR